MTTKTKGLICAIVGTTFWGMSGCAAQFLFSDLAVKPAWLVSVRLLISGVWCLAPGVEYGDHPQTSHAGMAQKT